MHIRTISKVQPAQEVEQALDLLQQKIGLVNSLIATISTLGTAMVNLVNGLSALIGFVDDFTKDG
ncbi:MAG: hypothetical protein IIA14_07985 [SAR324 cluster bacterium]|nr:hypothetical protein [SAR324 cluster bacterium]